MSAGKRICPHDVSVAVGTSGGRLPQFWLEALRYQVKHNRQEIVNAATLDPSNEDLQEILRQPQQEKLGLQVRCRVAKDLAKLEKLFEQITIGGCVGRLEIRDLKHECWEREQQAA